nr:dihydrofolate synthetase [Quercus suber]
MIELGLQRINKLLSGTAFPWRAIHVAGTNGKGSICAYITESIQVFNRSQYRATNCLPSLKLAQFTSPHLVDRWDCITINQTPVSWEQFRKAEEKVIARDISEEIKASEFERLTATAFEIFCDQHVDIGVVEVGMGGRLDATNILGQSVETEIPGINANAVFRPLPLVTAIAKIGMDHQAFLGDTLQKIAGEKAGIMKSNVPVVIDDSNDPEALEVLQGKAGSRMVDYPPDAKKMIPTHLPRHMRDNLRIAQVATFSALSQLGYLPSFTAIEWTSDGIQDLQKAMLNACIQLQVAGRQQFIDISKLTKCSTTILCDGAHNTQSAEVLATSVQKIRDDTKQQITWVLATSNSKDCREILRPLLQPGDAVHAVAFGAVDGMPWVKATDPMEILTAAHELVPNLSKTIDHGCDVREALISAAEVAKDGPIVVAGSLYLAGDVHRMLKSI